MPDSVSASLWAAVAARAGRCCEYCLIHEEDTFLGCQVDHIISRKHDGVTEMANLALACVLCNSHKGSDLGSLVRPGGKLVRFFNPRTDRWADHFRLSGAEIEPLTDIGAVTCRILQLNHPDRIAERWLLLRLGRYPGRH